MYVGVRKKKIFSISPLIFYFVMVILIFNSKALRTVSVPLTDGWGKTLRSTQ